MKFRILVIAASLLFASFFTLLGQTNRNAEELYDQNNYAEAIAAYKQGLKSSSEGYESSALKIAEAYRAMDDAPNAVRWYGRVLKTGKESFDTMYFLHYAQMLSFIGKHNEARHWYDLFANDSSNMFGDRFQTYLEYEYNDSIRLEIFNLNINTANDEYSAAFYGDSIAFVGGLPHKQTRYYENEISSEKYYDLFYSSLVGEGLYSKPQKFPTDINSQLNEGPMVFHDDKLYFTRNIYKDVKEIKKKDKDVRLRIFESTMSNGELGGSAQMPFDGDYSVGHPAISPDGNKLYFSSDMPGGYGGSDLYVCNRQGGSWSAPENMGAKINTDGNELFPFAHTNGDLFFASNEHNGLGGLDIFKVNVNGNQTVINLEEPINSAQDDFAFVINPDENKGFFSSNRVGGKGGDDIYGFVSAGISVNIQVFDFQTGDPIPEAKISVSDLYGSFIYEESDPSGEAQFQAKSKRSYEIFVQSPGYESKTQNLQTDENLSDPILYAIVWLDRLAGRSSTPSNNNFDRSRLNREDESRVRNYETNRPRPQPQAENRFESRENQGNAYVDPFTEQRTENRYQDQSRNGYDFIDLKSSNGNHQYFLCSENAFYQMVNVLDRSYLISGRDRIGLQTSSTRMRPTEILEANSYPVNQVITINDVFFSASSTKVDDASKRELDKIIRVLKKQPALNISLKGFANDAAGTDLAKKRVDNVCKYLMQNGIAQSRVFPSQHGNDCPSNCAGDPSENRKVEMSLNASIYGR